MTVLVSAAGNPPRLRRYALNIRRVASTHHELLAPGPIWHCLRNAGETRCVFPRKPNGLAPALPRRAPQVGLGEALGEYWRWARESQMSPSLLFSSAPLPVMRILQIRPVSGYPAGRGSVDALLRQGPASPASDQT